jgi:hypothetical protein
MLFLLIGYFGTRKKVIPLRLALDAIFIYYFVRAIDLALRAYLTFFSAYPDANPSFENIMVQGTYVLNVKRIVLQIVTVSIIALIVLVAGTLFLRKTKGRLLDDADVLILCFGILVTGWPNFLIYLFLVFACTALWVLLIFIFNRKQLQERMPITPFFVVAGILMLFWGTALSQLTGLYALR